MPAYAGIAGYHFDQRVADLMWIKRTEPQTQQPGHVPNSLHEIDDSQRRIQIRAVCSQMDPGQHDLPVPGDYQILRFLNHMVQKTTATAPAKARNHTVRAELIAAILDLDHGAGLTFRMSCRYLFILPAPAYSNHGVNRLPGSDDIFHQVDNPSSAGGADYHIHPRNSCHFGGCLLSVAPHGDHSGLRIASDSASDHLTRFFRPGTGDTAGVDHIDIGLFIKADYPIAALAEHARHGLGLIGVNLTPQCHKGCSFGFCHSAQCDPSVHSVTTELSGDKSPLLSVPSAFCNIIS